MNVNLSAILKKGLVYFHIGKVFIVEGKWGLQYKSMPKGKKGGFYYKNDYKLKLVKLIRLKLFLKI